MHSNCKACSSSTLDLRSTSRGHNRLRGKGTKALVTAWLTAGKKKEKTNTKERMEKVLTQETNQDTTAKTTDYKEYIVKRMWPDIKY